MPNTEDNSMKMIFQSLHPKFAILRDQRQWIVCMSYSKDKKATGADLETLEGTLTRKEDGTYVRWIPSAYFASFEQALYYIHDQLAFRFFEAGTGFEGYAQALEKATKVIERIGREMKIDLEVK